MATTTARPAAAVDDRVGTRSIANRLMARPEVGSLLAALVILVLFLAVAEPFRAVANIGTILYGASTIGIMAVPVALLMIGGEFDLSAGVAVTTSGLTASMAAYQLGLNVFVGILIALAVSLAIGAANGWMLNKTGMPSFLVTLGSFFILQGVNLGVTRIITGNVASPTISDMDGYAMAQNIFASEFKIGPVNVKITIIYWLLLTAVAAYVLLRTKVGNWIFATGGDAAAARAVGVPVRKVKVGLFMAVGFCAWIAGMHLLFGFNNIQSGEGVGREFIFIIAAVIGGCLLTGGYGSVTGATIGALIFSMTQLGIVYAGWQADWFKTFLGVMLLLATIVNLLVKKRGSSR
ncbi:MAG TPA: ABC transporter permease [Dermatophilaceae bacterium]|nr:ABC transporter permease [Dermatophilaceae bacterium]